MPVLSPCVDIKSLIEQHAGIKVASDAIVHGEREYHSNCPWCGGTDRFITRPEAGTYSCAIRSGGCKRHGDMLDFLKDYCDMTMLEACEEIGLDPDEYSFYEQERRINFSLARNSAPADKWRSRAEAIVHMAQQVLWAPRGNNALEELCRRGFTDELILERKFGYIPTGSDGKWLKDSVDEWGLSDIPWYVKDPARRVDQDQIWKLEVRRLTNPGPNKIPTIIGSRDTLYNLDAIQPGKPAVLTEAAFDAASGIQVCGDEAAFVATGGVDKAKYEQWVKRLEQASCVLVAFDDDEPNEQGKRAGDEGAQFWMDALPNAMRYLPWGHDLNDLLRDGKDIRRWLMKGLKSYERLNKAKSISASAVTVAVPIAHCLAGALPSVHKCSICHIDLNDSQKENYIDENSKMYCRVHWHMLRGYADQLCKETIEERYFLAAVRCIAEGLEKRYREVSL